MSRYLLLALHVFGLVLLSALAACAEAPTESVDAGPLDAAPDAMSACVTFTASCASGASVTAERCASRGRCEVVRGARRYPCPGDCATCAEAERAMRADACAPTTCSGTPAACSTRPRTSCERGDGCRATSLCGGTAGGCGGRAKPECAYQRGCSWSVATSSCVGAAWGCPLFSGASTCGTQSGCRWESVCDGTPQPCAEHTITSCTQTPGCSLGY